jgi:DNA invertase Pin-like site-specific DNA recombinase
MTCCFNFVVLGQLHLNPQFSLPAPTDRAATTHRPDRRRRITRQLREEVVRRYVSENQTALEISEECGIGKSTVLRVLKAAEVPMRRQGEKRL